MGASTRTIRRRIKSVGNTRKITKAMELVAAAKMRKAISAVLASRPYADAAWRAITELAKVSDPSLHPLLKQRDRIGRVLMIVFTSDRGLCGALNGQVLKAVFESEKKFERVEYLTIGKKGQDALRRLNRPIVATFTGIANNPSLADIRPAADLARADFVAGTYDAVFVAATDYRSALVQKPTIARLLPIARLPGIGEVSEALAGVEKAPSSQADALRVSPDRGFEFIFEPSPAAILDVMLPRIVEVQMYQALLESAASEHAARMLAMRSASDSAGEMIDDLTFTFNQIRQAGITREIAEISSGAAAIAS